MNQANRNLILGEIALALLLALMIISVNGNLIGLGFLVVSIFHLFKYIVREFYKQSSGLSVKMYQNVLLYSGLFMVILVVLTALRTFDLRITQNVILLQIMYFILAIQHFFIDRREQRQRLILRIIFAILLCAVTYYGRVLYDYELVKVVILAPILPLIVCGSLMLVFKKNEPCEDEIINND